MQLLSEVRVGHITGTVHYMSDELCFQNCCCVVQQKGAHEFCRVQIVSASHVPEHGAINTGDKNDQDPHWHYLLDVIKSTKHSQTQR